MLRHHRNVVLQFSGGADSRAALHLLRGQLDRVTVMFTDPGGVYPHVVDYVHQTCAELGARLHVVRPPVPVQVWHDSQGLPSDIVPEWATADVAAWRTEKPPQLLQSTRRCCNAMLWQPSLDFLRRSGATALVRGVKRGDERLGLPHGAIDAFGIQHLYPLWEWSDADVLAYLAAEGVELPAHYGAVKDSLDCWLCTGHTGTHYARAKLDYTRRHHPELWPALADRLARVRAAVADEVTRHGAVLAVLDEEES